MKNGEKYRTPEERAKAIERFCDRFDTCKECKARNNVSCILSWLEMEAEVEAERSPAIGTDGAGKPVEAERSTAIGTEVEAERSPAIGTDGAGKPIETRLESGAFLTPKKVLEELAHGCASTQEPEKKRTNLEFCGLKLNRYSYQHNTLYVGQRDFRPCGEKQVFQIKASRRETGRATGIVTKNGIKMVDVEGCVISMSMLERFMIGGLHAVLKRKEYQQKKTKARRKAKKAANRPIGDQPSGREATK